jgi:hypothetical protein
MSNNDQHSADALRNGWNPKIETLDQWRARRSAIWKAERDRVLRTGDY